MEIKISDLLPASGIEPLPNPCESDAERVRASVMRKLREDNMNNTKRRPRRLARTLLIAAAVAATLTVAGLAAAHGFGELSHGKEAQSPYRSEPRDIIEVLPADSPAYKAGQELEQFRREVQAGQPRGGITQEEYEQVMADNERIAEKYLELAEKYGLKPARVVESADSLEELLNGLYEYTGVRAFSLLPREDPRSIIPRGSYTDCGSVSYGGAFTLPKPISEDNPMHGAVEYSIVTTVEGTFTTGSTAVYLDEFDEWEYETAGGVRVLLGMGERKSLLYAELEHCRVLASVRAGSVGADAEVVTSELDWNRGCHTAITREDLEYFADSIDFAALDDIAAFGQQSGE